MKLLSIVLIVLTLISIAVFSLQSDYSVLARFKYVDIGTSTAFNQCLQNVCTNPNLIYSSPNAQGTHGYTDAGNPDSVVIGPVFDANGNQLQESVCGLADSQFGENDASRDGVLDCCNIRKAAGITIGASEPCA